MAIAIFFSYPSRLNDLVKTFGHSKSYSSKIINSYTNALYERVHPLLTTLDAPWFDPQALADTTARVCPLYNCLGFIDGTVRYMCRPTYDQERNYSGHKRRHGLKYQGLLLSNGVILMHGPVEGRRHDSMMLSQTDLLRQLSALPPSSDGGRFHVYGDAAYAHHELVQVPYKNLRLTGVQQEFNEIMAEYRECVEFAFGKITQYFSFVDFHKNQKLHLQAIAKHYLISTFFTNCHTCLYGSTFTKKLNSEPPSLEAYIQ